jgi:hypothetical protein
MLTTFRIDDALISYSVGAPLLAELTLFPEAPIHLRGAPGEPPTGTLYATGVPAARRRLDARGITPPVCNATERIIRNFLADQPAPPAFALAPQELALVQLLDGFEAVGRGYRGFLFPWDRLGLRTETTRFLQLVFLTVLLNGARDGGELTLQTSKPPVADPNAPPSAPVVTALARLEKELDAAPPLGPIRIDELPFLIRLNTLASVGRADAFPELHAQERALAPRTSRPTVPPAPPPRITPKATVAVSTSSWLPPESTPFRPWGQR